MMEKGKMLVRSYFENKNPYLLVFFMHQKKIIGVSKTKIKPKTLKRERGKNSKTIGFQILVKTFFIFFLGCSF